MNKPEKPNITIPESFAVNGVKADFDDNKILNGFDRIQPDVLAGDNLNKFIDDTYKGLNYALDFGDYIDTKVNKSGDTMTGNLTIKDSYGGFLQGVRTGVNFGDKPASQQNIGGFQCYVNDVAGSNTTAIVQGFIKTTTNQSSNGIQFVTRKPDNSGWGASMYLETLADGTIFFNFPKCTAKATTTSTASDGKVAVIVQNYVNGTSWYRVWSDGWIEQGGVKTGAGYSAAVTVTLLKAFSNTNYCLQISGNATSPSVIFSGGYASSKATGSFKLATTINGTTVDNAGVMSWYACGY